MLTYLLVRSPVFQMEQAYQYHSFTSRKTLIKFWLLKTNQANCKLDRPKKSYRWFQTIFLFHSLIILQWKTFDIPTCSDRETATSIIRSCLINIYHIQIRFLHVQVAPREFCRLLQAPRTMLPAKIDKVTKSSTWSIINDLNELSRPEYQTIIDISPGSCY